VSILTKLAKLYPNEYKTMVIWGTVNQSEMGILEIRIHYAKGYRIYLKDVHGKIVILLNGGDKSKQQEDILKAKQIWKELKIVRNNGN
jgi:putative addiction module killer protein